MDDAELSRRLKAIVEPYRPDEKAAARQLGMHSRQGPAWPRLLLLVIAGIFLSAAVTAGLLSADQPSGGRKLATTGPHSSVSLPTSTCTDPEGLSCALLSGMAQYQALRPDAEKIVAYGITQPDWRGVEADTIRGRVHLIALFTGDLAQHRSALLARVTHKSLLMVERSRYSLRQLNAVKAVVDRALAGQNDYGEGLELECVQVIVVKGSAAESAASQLRTRDRKPVCIDVVSRLGGATPSGDGVTTATR